MAHNVETMFYAGREKPWHGLGRQVHEALTAEEAIKMAGLDWNVIQYPVYDQFGLEIPGYKACQGHQDYDRIDKKDGCIGKDVFEGDG